MTGITNLQTLFGAADGAAETKSVRTPIHADPAKAGTVQQPDTVGVDSSQLSSAGALMAAGDSSDVRLDKVAQLRSAIASGSYNVSAGAVADKLIHSMLGKG